MESGEQEGDYEKGIDSCVGGEKKNLKVSPGVRKIKTGTDTERENTRENESSS